MLDGILHCSLWGFLCSTHFKVHRNTQDVARNAARTKSELADSHTKYLDAMEKATFESLMWELALCTQSYGLANWYFRVMLQTALSLQERPNWTTCSIFILQMTHSLSLILVYFSIFYDIPIQLKVQTYAAYDIYERYCLPMDKCLCRRSKLRGI